MAAKRAADTPATLRVTWIRSAIGHRATARGTIRALGLRRLHHSVEVPDTPQTRGMLRRVAFLVDVSEPNQPGPRGEPGPRREPEETA